MGRTTNNLASLAGMAQGHRANVLLEEQRRYHEQSLGYQNHVLTALMTMMARQNELLEEQNRLLAARLG